MSESATQRGSEPDDDWGTTGLRLTCRQCGAWVLMPHTDSTRQSIDVRPAEGWELDGTLTFCPRCSPVSVREAHQ